MFFSLQKSVSVSQILKNAKNRSHDPESYDIALSQWSGSKSQLNVAPAAPLRSHSLFTESQEGGFCGFLVSRLRAI